MCSLPPRNCGKIPNVGHIWHCDFRVQRFANLFSELSYFQSSLCQKCCSKLPNSPQIVGSPEEFCTSCVAKLVKGAKRTDIYAFPTVSVAQYKDLVEYDYECSKHSFWHLN
jgi:predicted amidophosphoribosyltransferase